MMQPEPIVLTREEHIRQIHSYWRQKDADRLRDEVLFEDDERTMVEALFEDEWPSDRRASHKLAALIFQIVFWVMPLAVVGWEILRP